MKNINRNMTWLDLIFIMMTEIVKDKHLLITRYPIEQYQNIIPTKISIITTKETETVVLNDGTTLTNYPKIDKDAELYQVDTLWMSNSYLNSLGADFDGKQTA